MASLHFFAT